MLKKTLLLTGGLLICTSATHVEAGQTQHYPVTINDSSDYAYATMVGARTSANSTEYLYCYVRDRNDIISGPSGPWLTCYARDASGTTRVCVSTDPAQIEIAAGITDSSYVYFNWSESFFGTFCEDLRVRHGSLYME